MYALLCPWVLDITLSVVHTTLSVVRTTLLVVNIVRTALSVVYITLSVVATLSIANIDSVGFTPYMVVLNITLY